MNLEEFTEQVDRCAQSLSQEELRGFLHNFARKVPEKEREEFLELLRLAGETGQEGDTQPEEAAAVRGIRPEYERLLELFSQIQAGERFLTAESYEVEQEAYWDSDWEWAYQDDQGIGEIYEEASLLLEQCVNDGFYPEAEELAECLLDTDVTVENDEDEYLDMGLEELVEEKIASIHLKELAAYILYAAYMVSPPEQRAEELFQYYQKDMFRQVPLENMLRVGKEELPDLPAFWDSWIQLLSRQQGVKALWLLKETIRSQFDAGKMLEVAREAYEIHPSLYLEALEMMKGSASERQRTEVGKEALEKVDVRYVIRSRIARETAGAALRSGQESVAAVCWREAFLSDSTPTNYLRWVNESGEPEECGTVARRMASQLPKKQNFGAVSLDSSLYRMPDEQTENALVSYSGTILRFLAGDFDYAWSKCQKEKEPLGWTGHFVKCGISLFLLLLYQGEQLESGCAGAAWEAMKSMGFDSAHYLQGTRQEGETESDPAQGTAIFWKAFCSWKRFYPLTEKQANLYLRKLETLIDKRIRAIVSGQFRNHYYASAQLAAALGEVKESRGERGAKENILQHYRREFPRHSSFHAALRDCGMSRNKR